jgi:hypothetical protein
MPIAKRAIVANVALTVVASARLTVRSLIPWQPPPDHRELGTTCNFCERVELERRDFDRTALGSVPFQHPPMNKLAACGHCLTKMFESVLMNRPERMRSEAPGGDLNLNLNLNLDFEFSSGGCFDLLSPEC